MDYLLPFLFLLIAFIYSSVGLGGGSSYTALMAIFGINYQIIPTTSLTMNLIVTFISMIHFWKNDHGRLNIIIPFLVTSIPMAYFAGTLELPERIFNIFLLITLIFVVIRIYLINDLKISVTEGIFAAIQTDMITLNKDVKISHVTEVITSEIKEVCNIKDEIQQLKKV